MSDLSTPSTDPPDLSKNEVVIDRSAFLEATAFAHEHGGWAGSWDLESYRKGMSTGKTGEAHAVRLLQAYIEQVAHPLSRSASRLEDQIERLGDYATHGAICTGLDPFHSDCTCGYAELVREIWPAVAQEEVWQ